MLQSLDVCLVRARALIHVATGSFGLAQTCAAGGPAAFRSVVGRRPLRAGGGNEEEQYTGGDEMRA